MFSHHQLSGDVKIDHFTFVSPQIGVWTYKNICLYLHHVWTCENKLLLFSGNQIIIGENLIVKMPK